MPNSDNLDSGGFLSTSMVSLGVSSDCSDSELDPVAMDRGKNDEGRRAGEGAVILL